MIVTYDLLAAILGWSTNLGGVSVLETILVYVLIPAGIFLLIALLAARKGLTRRTRYRPGDPWTYPPVWWSANPAGAELPEVGAHADATQSGSSRGGADGSW